MGCAVVAAGNAVDVAGAGVAEGTTVSVASGCVVGEFAVVVAAGSESPPPQPDAIETTAVTTNSARTERNLSMSRTSPLPPATFAAPALSFRLGSRGILPTPSGKQGACAAGGGFEEFGAAGSPSRCEQCREARGRSCRARPTLSRSPRRTLPSARSRRPAGCAWISPSLGWGASRRGLLLPRLGAAARARPRGRGEAGVVPLTRPKPG